MYSIVLLKPVINCCQVVGHVQQHHRLLYLFMAKISWSDKGRLSQPAKILDGNTATIELVF